MDKPAEPFMKLPKSIADREDLSFPAKVVFAAVVDFLSMGKTPGIRAIAAAVGRPKDPNLVTRALRELVELKLIQVKPGKVGTRATYSTVYAEQAPTGNRRLLRVDASVDSEQALAPTQSRHRKTRQGDNPPQPPQGGQGRGGLRGEPGSRSKPNDISSNNTYRHLA